MALLPEKWGAAAISIVCFVAITSLGFGLVKSGPVNRYEEENPMIPIARQTKNEDPYFLAAKQILKKTPIIDGYLLSFTNFHMIHCCR